MHTYAGNPANYPAAITLMDDGVDVPSFTNFNTGYEGLADRTAYLFGLVGAVHVNNWQPAFTPSGNVAIDCPWNPVLRAWQYVQYNSGSTELIAAPYTGADQVEGGTSTLSSVATAPVSAAVGSDGVLYVLGNDVVYACPVPPGSFGSIASLGGTTDSGSVIATVGTNWVAVVTTGVNSGYYWGPSNSSYTNNHTITPFTAPGQWAIAPQTGPGASQVLFFPVQAGQNIFIGGATGAPTHVAMTSFLGASDAPQSAVWMPNFQVTPLSAPGAWIIAVAVGGGSGPTQFWATNNGTSFVKLSQISNMAWWGVTSAAKSTWNTTQLVQLGPLIVSRAYDSGGELAFLAYSLDAVNWQPVDTLLYGTSQAQIGLRASDNRLCSFLYNGATSDQLQFSLAAGLPAGQLT